LGGLCWRAFALRRRTRLARLTFSTLRVVQTRGASPRNQSGHMTPRLWGGGAHHPAGLLLTSMQRPRCRSLRPTAQPAPSITGADWCSCRAVNSGSGGSCTTQSHGLRAQCAFPGTLGRRQRAIADRAPRERSGILRATQQSGRTLCCQRKSATHSAAATRTTTHCARLDIPRFAAANRSAGGRASRDCSWPSFRGNSGPTRRARIWLRACPTLRSVRRAECAQPCPSVVCVDGAPGIRLQASAPSHTTQHESRLVPQPSARAGQRRYNSNRRSQISQAQPNEGFPTAQQQPNTDLCGQRLLLCHGSLFASRDFGSCSSPPRVDLKYMRVTECDLS